ncbi:GNAT family N-acetyltransferase [Telmatospirillum sp. J64-1]|uniref:GNAT family N-acetyltransferase n=1 Tax=Telmatospirillum sp. J64-1 TaxID=2502183 RepID=UPI00115E7AC1|nr:GNAT family N-acetyltransferase [Telmatospirillum sp. J64-1]
MTISYAAEPGLDPDEFIDVLNRSGLGKRRPVRDPHRIARMIAQADLVLTARDETGLLVGVARSVTDFSYCCYLSDLAVDEAFQRRGIGRELIRRTQEAAGSETSLFLIAAPDAAAYYPHIGLEKVERAWMVPRQR